MIKKLTQQLKEPERDYEGIEFQVEGSDGSDVVISSQVKGEKEGSIMTLRQAKRLARYNEAKCIRGLGLGWFFEGFFKNLLKTY